jgi:hypothetical protein
MRGYGANASPRGNDEVKPAATSETSPYREVFHFRIRSTPIIFPKTRPELCRYILWNLLPASRGGRYMMRANRVKSEKFQGVYIQKSGLKQDDEAYYILYRDKNRRLFWEKVGWKNDGYTEEEAFKVRSARIKEIQLSKGSPVQRPELRGETVIRKKRTGISNREGISLRLFIAGIELCRTTVLKDLRVHELYLILLAIETNGIRLKEFRKLLQLPPGAVSRNVRKLGFHMIQRPDGRWRDSGVEMIEVYRDPKCRRYKKVKLTNGEKSLLRS